MIPFVDLKAQYLSIKTEVDNAISTILNNSSFIGGEDVEKFETEFANFLNLKYVIGCANGTDSIEILLKALGLGAGDEVIVPAISWISTSEAVSNVGATPVFVDIEENFFTINADLIEQKITNKTKAIIPVHLYGQVCEMDKILAIAKKYKLFVLEDVAQAHNAQFKGQLTGTFGDCASFSFYPGKNLGAYGDAGGMVTNDKNIAAITKMIANHGQVKKHTHLIEGRNSRLDALQASVLSVKLPYLEKWTLSRIENAKHYSKLLRDVKDIVTPETRESSRHVFHLYVIRTKRRDAFQKFLSENGVQTAIHYPKALPFLDCYKKNNYNLTDFPVAASIQSEILSLPMYPELSIKDIEFICQKIKDFFI